MHQAKNRRQRHRPLERALGRALNRWPIGGWIGKRDAELDTVGAAGVESAQDLESRFQIGIARRDKGNQRGFAAFFQFSECFFNTAHGLTSSSIV